ncbi:MAG: hypothetical protein INR72_12595 [Williamsia herbipolensis]|uniref:hypothetical protein n=1 Tax=uncultured Williamsia sp. TaxID=259311 RepID=UPI0019E8F978|nr:hypothetical protein [uncultured Williamsia sp.]MBE7162077.1 hypothetical protein [Williamsia herbipolensis]
MPELSTVTTVTPGAVMTDEVGVITGSVEIVCACDGSAHATVRVRYEDAAEWYRVSDLDRDLTSADELDAFHREIVERFTTPTS